MATQHKPEAYISAAADFFDQLVPVATDDQLFASGYLRGHFDLAVGTLEVSGEDFARHDVIEQVSRTLQQAVTAGELNEQDLQLVSDIWQQLKGLAA